MYDDPPRYNRMMSGSGSQEELERGNESNL
jgi:hypothetical protein